MLSKTAASQTPRRPAGRGDQLLQRPVHAARRPERRGHRDLFSTGGSKVTLTGSATVATNFLSVLGYRARSPSAASTTSTWGNTRLRVALVLDNTGSMASDDKMTALKTASQNLLDQLKSAAMKPRRRLCLDRSVQQGRQCRHRAITPAVLAALGPVGRRTNGQLAAISTLHNAKLRCVVAQQVLDAGQPQHLERLRHRPRPEFRHHQRRAGRRQHALSGRAVFVLPDRS